MDIRQLILDAMQRQEISQTALERMTGVRQHRISEYLTGKRDMNSDNVVKLLEALDLEIRPRESRGGRRRK